MSLGNQNLPSIEVDGTLVDVIGCWNEETPENEFDFYDFFIDGECINLGEPCYEKPTAEAIRPYLEIWKEMR